MAELRFEFVVEHLRTDILPQQVKAIRPIHTDLPAAETLIPDLINIYEEDGSYAFVIFDAKYYCIPPLCAVRAIKVLMWICLTASDLSINHTFLLLEASEFEYRPVQGCAVRWQLCFRDL